MLSGTGPQFPIKSASKPNRFQNYIRWTDFRESGKLTIPTKNSLLVAQPLG
jgi:hypothetical protein